MQVGIAFDVQKLTIILYLYSFDAIYHAYQNKYEGHYYIIFSIAAGCLWRQG
jgi:hypothetical protein